MVINNCEKQAVNSETLQAKLVLPSKLLIMYLKHVNKLILIRNYQFYLGNAVRVHWQ